MGSNPAGGTNYFLLNFKAFHLTSAFRGTSVLPKAMEPTTIIGLSLCVVILATALGVVLTQKKTETIIVRKPDLYKSIKIFSGSWQKSYSFRIAPPGYDNSKSYYYLAP
jgi:hypothetical protein